MNGADPLICSSKGIDPIMATSNLFLKIYLKQVAKAHSLLHFIYDEEKRKEILKKIHDKIVIDKSDLRIFKLYDIMRKKTNNETYIMRFYQILQESQKKVKRIIDYSFEHID